MDASPQETHILNPLEKSLHNPPEVLKDEINGKEVYFVGITHTPKYFDEHREKLVEMIKKGSIIVPEYFPFENTKSLEPPAYNSDDAQKFYWLFQNWPEETIKP